MKGFHVVTGTPRSGSTLLCNILNQNKSFYASSTSPLYSVANAANYVQSDSDEVLSDLINDSIRTQARIVRVYKAVIEAWYAEKGKKTKVVFDKGRHWTFSGLELAQAYPDAKMIVMVRDHRDIVASVEKQHRKNPMFSHANDANEKTLFDRASTMMAQDSFVGQPTVGVEDAMRRNHKNMMIIKYEALVEDPELVLRRIYSFIEQDAFEHDFDNVENVADDVDALWLNKFPHEGCGKVEKADGSWMDFIDADTAAHVNAVYPYYNEILGYR